MWDANLTAYKSRRNTAYFYALDMALNCLFFMPEKVNISCRNGNGKGKNYGVLKRNFRRRLV